jgi:hypothetical protein
MDNMTPAQQLQFSYCRFKLSVLSLMLLMSAFLFFNVFHHTVSMFVLIYALVYIVVLNIGMRGATNRSVGMLRFYWVFQLVQLIVFLLTVLAVVVMFTYWHVREARHMHRGANKPLLPHGDATLPHVDAELPHADATLPREDQRVIMIAEVKTHQSYNCPISSMLHLLLPAVLFLIVVFSKTRSIVLARQLIALIETNAGTDIEMDNCCDKESKKECCEKSSSCCEEKTPAPAQNASIAVYSPEAVYIMPQSYMPSADGSYPGLMPVYVDKFGKATE